jgi:hypothetical protein
LLLDVETAAQRGFGFRVSRLIDAQFAEVSDSVQRVRVPGTEHALAHLDDSGEERVGLCVLAFFLED